MFFPDFSKKIVIQGPKCGKIKYVATYAVSCHPISRNWPRPKLDAHAFAQDAAVGAGIRSQGRTLLDPVDREILNVVRTGFPSESAPEEESPFEHEYAADVSLIQVVEGTNG